MLLKRPAQRYQTGYSAMLQSHEKDVNVVLSTTSSSNSYVDGVSIKNVGMIINIQLHISELQIVGPSLCPYI
jgi:hypothetical protein